MYVFSIAFGLLYLSTVPLTSGVVAHIFGVQYLAMLSGFVFFSHQIGAFFGAWLGGRLYDQTGSYAVFWGHGDRPRRSRGAVQPADPRETDSARRPGGCLRGIRAPNRNGSKRGINGQIQGLPHPRNRQEDRRAFRGDIGLDDLDPGEVVIRVAYSGVNYKDALAATGAGKIIRRFPCVGGIDLSGTVVESGDARFKKGDAVLATSFDIGVAHDGGYAEYARIPADWVVPMPKGLSLFEAMALGTAGYTAALAVLRMEHDGLAPANGPVIVTGATGGVGSIAIDMLSRLGYHVVALTGKEAEAGYLKQLGAKEVMLRSSLDLSKDPAARQGHVGRRRGQPRRRGARMAGEHHEAGRHHRLHRTRREPESQHHGRSFHFPRGKPAWHRFRLHAHALEARGMAAPRHRHAPGASEGDDPDHSLRRVAADFRAFHQGAGARPHRGRSGGVIAERARETE